MTGTCQISAHEVKDALEARGIQFDRVLVDAHLERDRHTGQFRPVHGLHHYFMLGDRDVAYFTPLMGSLTIHDQPRPWGDSVLNAAQDITPLYR